MALASTTTTPQIVITFERMLPYMEASFPSQGTVDADGTIRVTAPDGVRTTPPKPGAAARLRDLVARLAPYQARTFASSPCTLTFHGQGQTPANGLERQEIAELAGC